MNVCTCILRVLFNLLFVCGGNVFFLKQIFQCSRGSPLPPTLPLVPESHEGPTHLCLSFLCTHSSFVLWVRSCDLWCHLIFTRKATVSPVLVYLGTLLSPSVKSCLRSWFLADGCFPLQHFEHHPSAFWIRLCLVRGPWVAHLTGVPCEWPHFSPAAFKILSLSLTFSRGWWGMGTCVLYLKVRGSLGGRAGLFRVCAHRLWVLFLFFPSLLPVRMLFMPVLLHSACLCFSQALLLTFFRQCNVHRIILKFPGPSVSAGLLLSPDNGF